MRHEKKMEKQIAMRLADPAFALLKDLADADERSPTEVARRILITGLADLAYQRQRAAGGSTAGGSGTPSI
ncbi:hypothetical protein [Bradyrhizobium sp.]|uniref:hypothetical protein n=1 Tax=Bradyrhizobium sp. TaxID=376 RepID=UPI002D5FD512|nr:hypothetical protein [Bradyrhizobium sp.]HZR74552.1 hypothetical protein [Bradyrhizobium sp.]